MITPHDGTMRTGETGGGRRRSGWPRWLTASALMPLLVVALVVTLGAVPMGTVGATAHGSGGIVAQAGMRARGGRLPVGLLRAWRAAHVAGTGMVQAPLAATPWSQQATLTAADGQPGDDFGVSVALSGDTAVVGAYYKNNVTGAAYVYVRRGTSWSQQAELTAADGQQGDWFGIAVALSGDTAVVGAWAKNNNTGAAYVFVRRGTSWSQQAELTAADGQAHEAFGFSVALSGDTAVIGALFKNSYSGAAYVYVRSGTSWSPQAELTAADGQYGDEFGNAVALSGDTAVVGDIGNNIGTGAAYVYVRRGTSWTPQAKLTAADGQQGDEFGYSVALSGDTAVVGAPVPYQNTVTGAAYVYVRSGTSWSPQAKLTAADGQGGDQFGFSVALSGDTAVVGAYGKNNKTGAAYVYVRSGTSWSPQAELTAADGQSGDYFGVAVALSGGTAVVGAAGKNNNTGAAYVFVRASQGATLVTNPTSGTVGQTLTLTGTNFGRSEIVNVYADTTTSAPIYAASTDSTGGFVIVRHVMPEPYGAHTLIGVGQTSQISATAPFFEQTSLVLQPTAGAPSATVGVTGNGFGEGEQVRLHWDTPTGLLLRHDVTNSRGTLSSFFVVPKGATPGQHLVYGAGQRTDAQAAAVFTVQ